MDSHTEGVSAAKRYMQLAPRRVPYLNRAEKAARLTIPSIIPETGFNSTAALPLPNQSTGARGVNTLASKLLLSLLPPASSFFRMSISPLALRQLSEDPQAVTAVEQDFSDIEKEVLSFTGQSSLRVTLWEALKHLLVAGNVLLHVPDDGHFRMIGLRNYVVLRDPMGDVLEVVVEQEAALATLPEAVLDIVNKSPKGHTKGRLGTEKTVKVYLHAIRVGDKFEYYEEVAGVRVPGTEGNYLVEESPFIPLRMTKVDGEDYGRGHIEDNYGDLLALDEITEAIRDAARLSSRILFLVNPNGLTRARDIASFQSGDIKSGRREDISTLGIDKYPDLRVAAETMNRLEQKLAASFLMNTAVQRQGERVTAEEIRAMIGELEDALGGLYSILAQELQLPLVRRLMFVLRKKGQLPELPQSTIRYTLTTGVEALGRGHDLNKLGVFLQFAAQTAALPPEVNKSDVLSRAAIGIGIDKGGLIYTPEQMAQMQAQAQEDAMVQAMGPGAMQVVRDQMKPQPETNSAPQG